jgi:hypothetical protein
MAYSSRENQEFIIDSLKLSRFDSPQEYALLRK